MQQQQKYETIESDRNPNSLIIKQIFDVSAKKEQQKK